MRIVFFGTPEFAKTILEYLFQHKVEIVAVVTRPDKAKGRSSKLSFSPVKEFALTHDLPLYQPFKASDPEFVSFLKTLDADFFIVAAFAEILKESVLALPKLGCLNVHGSILPKYRGAAPVQRSLIAGESETGVTIMKMAPQVDAGDILEICKTEIPLSMNAEELMAVLADLGKVALLERMHALQRGEAQSSRQDASQVTLAKKLKAEEGQVNWHLPALVLHNHVRGFTPNPGAWCFVWIKGEKKRLILKKTWPESTIESTPATLVSQKKDELIVGCGQGALRLLELQLEGKKPMAADAFLRGISLEHLSFVSPT